MSLVQPSNSPGYHRCVSGDLGEGWQTGDILVCVSRTQAVLQLSKLGKVLFASINSPLGLSLMICGQGASRTNSQMKRLPGNGHKLRMNQSCAGNKTSCSCSPKTNETFPSYIPITGKKANPTTCVIISASQNPTKYAR